MQNSAENKQENSIDPTAEAKGADDQAKGIQPVAEDHSARNATQELQPLSPAQVEKAIQLVELKHPLRDTAIWRVLHSLRYFKNV